MPAEDHFQLEFSVVSTGTATFSYVFRYQPPQPVLTTFNKSTTTYHYVMPMPGSRAVDMIMEEWHQQQVDQLFEDAFHLHPDRDVEALKHALDNAQHYLGRLPTEEEIAACEKLSTAQKQALRRLLEEWEVWHHWNMAFAEDAPEHIGGYRDNARPHPRGQRLSESHPGRVRSLLATVVGWFRTWKLRLRHRVADPVLKQRVDEEHGTDLRWRVASDPQAEPALVSESPEDDVDGAVLGDRRTDF